MLTKRQKIKWIRPIVGKLLLPFGLLSFVLCPLSAKPKPHPKDTLTTERQQQFTYYWYAAKQAIQEERYPDAFALLLFCEQLNPQDGVTLGLLGATYEALGDDERAMKAYEQAFRNDPHDQWYRYAVALQNRHTDAAYKQLLRVLEQAHSVNPSDEDLLEQLRRLYLGLGKCKQSLRIQDEIDAIRGYDAYSAYNRVTTYAAWGKAKQAIKEVDRWLEMEPTDVQFMLYRIELMERTKAPAKDLYQVYEKVLRIDPRNLTVLNNYAYLLATQGGDLRKAEQMSQITIREEPDNSVYLDTYGWILHLQGQDQLALFYLNKALWKATDTTRTEIENHLKEVKK